ncbi:hypothetical protein FH508_0013025 [Lysinibacillus sp. CD3-6]|uniref:hypothetical protein n=1 Tax=Lysinibacillus sp. CD3-6 TaxID=2892541 RepID=UPI00155EB940|nr:hypothetical protein [Lysinibacillus sp. CD3-6]UED78388.1 hypothetical protein FH508_0013025 [Lysinibacillus sp. CD3-6]
MSDLITVKEVLEYATEFELCWFAHQVYWAVSTKQIQLEDDSNKLLEVAYDDAAVREMTNRNVLGIGRIKLYVVKSFAQYAFYFASDSLEVNMLHQAIFGEVAGAITEAHRLLTKVMYFADFDIQTSLLEYRKTFVQFPAYLGHAAAGQYNLYRLDLHRGGRRIV